MTEMDDLLISLFVAFGIICYTFIGNHLVQDVIDHSSHIFKDAYGTEWYKVPVMEQKLLLFFMRYNLKDLSVTFYYLFTPSHQGFSLVKYKTIFRIILFSLVTY
ncbi:uncharacterized protein LOC143371414 [Andrena cerasifolii]|uniref:uncharacterized protein LOC143371414 n=1 Tax=Andrena cerasifolii TaxID=2819439 RepID=UPI00403799B9